MQSCGRPVGGAAREGNMDCGIRAAMQTDGVYDSRTSPPTNQKVHNAMSMPSHSISQT